MLVQLTSNFAIDAEEFHMPEVQQLTAFLLLYFQFLIGIIPTLEMTKRLGETHQARWTGNLRYMLKMLLCLDHFPLGTQQQMDLIAHCFYIIYIHVFFWFSATHMADIPFLTLTLRQDLVAWHARDHGAAQAALRKVDLHTEYLTGRSVILALASEQVDERTKGAMAQHYVPP